MTQLLPIINIPFKWPVWRMEIDEISSNLFIEIRSQEEKKASFASIDLLNGIINFQDVTTPERWLTGIETAYDNVLLIHNYQSESGPAHKGLIAIDGKTGETLWSNYTLAFDHLSINGPVLYNTQFQPPKLMLADIHTGNTLRPYEYTADHQLNNSIIAPKILPLAEVTNLLLPYPPHANTLHYISHNNLRIVSLHAFLNEQLKQHLYIFNSEGQIVYHDLLNSDIQKLQPEAFVVHKNSLIYLKNRSELIVLNL